MFILVLCSPYWYLTTSIGYTWIHYMLACLWGHIINTSKLKYKAGDENATNSSVCLANSDFLDMHYECLETSFLHLQMSAKWRLIYFQLFIAWRVISHLESPQVACIKLTETWIQCYTLQILSGWLAEKIREIEDYFTPRMVQKELWQSQEQSQCIVSKIKEKVIVVISSYNHV